MAPPLTVGQFGGDTDNWEWPRHNGDFSLVRAYVGPDGKPAPYSENNIPYTPKNKLKVNPAGTQDGDFVFIMGYPGRTFRHESGAFLDFQKKVQLPTIQSFFKQYIDWMKQLSANDEGKRLSFAGSSWGASPCAVLHLSFSHPVKVGVTKPPVLRVTGCAIVPVNSLRWPSRNMMKATSKQA
jgi:hypothetical protein